MARVKPRIGGVVVSLSSAAGFASSLSAAPPVPQVGPEILVPLDPLYSTLYHRVEPAIAVTPHSFGTPSQVHPHEIVIACNTSGGTQPQNLRIEYNLSIDEGVTFHTRSANWIVPGCTPASTFDPMVAVSPTTGDLYFGGVLRGAENNQPNSALVQRRTYGFIAPPGDDWFNVAASAISCIPKLDKPFMAMGPQPAGSTVPVDALYVAHSPNAATTSELETVKAADVTYPVGATWGASYGITSEPGQVQRAGLGAYPVVIQSGLR